MKLAMETRHDAFTGTSVLVATHRQAVTTRSHGSLPEVSRAECPFCPGHERDTESTVLALPSESSWKVRVVGNKYPLTGAHEVLIETTEHDGDIHRYEHEHLVLVLQALLARVRAHRATPDCAFVSVFRNRGRRAGSSQPHPHLQIASLETVPHGVAVRDACARAWYTEHGINLLQHAIGEARDRDMRIVAENPTFVSFVPYAPHRPYELWVAPRSTELTFDALDDQHLAQLATALLDAATRLQNVLGDVDYNLLLRVPPNAEWSAASSFWFMEFAPRMSAGGAGFELSTGVDVLVTSPEVAAKSLRETKT